MIERKLRACPSTSSSEAHVASPELLGHELSKVERIASAATDLVEADARRSDSEELRHQSDELADAATDAEDFDEALAAASEADSLRSQAEALEARAGAVAQGTGFEDPWPPERRGVELAERALERLLELKSEAGDLINEPPFQLQFESLRDRLTNLLPRAGTDE